MEQIKTTFKFVVVLAVAASFAACAVKKAERTSLKKPGQGPVEDKAKVGACVGGQPGVVEIQGAINQGADGKVSLDARLKLAPTAGKSEAGQVSEISQNAQASVKPVQGKVDMADVEADRTFINLGCESLGEATKGLTEKKISDAKDIALSKANRIFICGKVDLPAGMASLKAESIFMQDAVVTMNGNYPNTLLIQANNIGVKGHNIVTAKALNASVANANVPATLSLIVVKEMQSADGDLEIVSAGGDCVAAAQAPQDSQEPKQDADLDISTEAMPK